MAVKVAPGRKFLRRLKRLARKYPSLPADVARLAQALTVNPQLGTPLGSGCYKIRLAVASKGQGKSGGVRVITHVILRYLPTLDLVQLAAIYDKSQQETIEAVELKILLQELKDDEADSA